MFAGLHKAREDMEVALRSAIVRLKRNTRRLYECLIGRCHCCSTPRQGFNFNKTSAWIKTQPE